MDTNVFESLAGFNIVSEDELLQVVGGGFWSSFAKGFKDGEKAAERAFSF